MFVSILPVLQGSRVGRSEARRRSLYKPQMGSFTPGPTDLHWLSAARAGQVSDSFTGSYCTLIANIGVLCVFLNSLTFRVQEVQYCTQLTAKVRVLLCVLQLINVVIELLLLCA